MRCHEMLDRDIYWAMAVVYITSQLGLRTGKISASLLSWPELHKCSPNQVVSVCSITLLARITHVLTKSGS